MIEKIEWLAGKLGYKTVWRFVLETVAVVFGLYALSVILSLGWQSNVQCETFRPLIGQAVDCINNDMHPRVVCSLAASPFDANKPSRGSYWYEQPNGTLLQLPEKVGK